MVSSLRVQGSKEDYEYTWKFSIGGFLDSTSISLSHSYYVSFNGRQKDFSHVVYFLLWLVVAVAAAILQSHFDDEFLLLIFLFYFIWFYIFCYLKKCSSISFLHHSFSCFCLLVINNPPLPYVLNKIEEKK